MQKYAQPAKTKFATSKKYARYKQDICKKYASNMKKMHNIQINMHNMQEIFKKYASLRKM